MPTARRGSQGDGHIQRPDRQIAFHAVAHGPTDDAPGMKIEDDSQIQPALAGPDMADIAPPFRCAVLRFGLGRSAAKSRSSRFGAMLSLWSLSIVALNFLVLSTRLPFLRISPLTHRPPDHPQPDAAKARWSTRSAPHPCEIHPT
jgi:hypothetical protein